MLWLHLRLTVEDDTVEPSGVAWVRRNHAIVSSASTSAAKEYLSGVLGLPSRRSTWKLALILCDGMTVAGRAATRGRTVCQWDLECSPLGPRLSTTIVPSGSSMRRGHLMREEVKWHSAG